MFVFALDFVFLARIPLFPLPFFPVFPFFLSGMNVFLSPDLIFYRRVWCRRVLF